MSTDYGVHHAWGILLHDHEGGELTAKCCDYLRIAGQLESFGSLAEFLRSSGPGPAEQAIAGEIDAEREDDEDFDDAACRLLRPAVVSALDKDGIVVPADALLFWTGDEDERPGRCHTPADCIVVGYGMLRDPTKPLRVTESFRAKAEHRMWVWAG